MNQFNRFVISVVIVIITFLVSAILAGLFAEFIGVWKKPVIGSVAAFCVVLAGYASAPTHKQRASATWLVLGAIAARFLSATSPYPEDIPTLIPLYATYVSGFIALILCMVWHKRKMNKSSHWNNI